MRQPTSTALSGFLDEQTDIAWMQLSSAQQKTERLQMERDHATDEREAARQRVVTLEANLREAEIALAESRARSAVSRSCSSFMYGLMSSSTR